MKHLAGAIGLALLAPAAVAAEDVIELSPQTVTKWSYVLPQETWTTVRDEIRIPHDGQTGFAVEFESSMKLRVDTDGDGKPDTDVDGTQGSVTLRGRDAAGRPFTYPLRLQNDGKNWKYASRGVLRGGFHGLTLTLIDQNNDGRFDDFGADALVVGAGPAASFLSEVVNVAGDLFRLELLDGGRRAKLVPYDGPTATLDARSDFKSFGKLVAAVVRDGRRSFNLADVDAGGMKVPAGVYALVTGLAAKGTERVQIRTGRMRAVEVAAGGQASLVWGGPVVAEFEYTRAGDELTVQPDVRFYGAAGEEYHTFKPDAKSPRIVVLDKKTRKELASGRFGGC